jgi:transposase
LGERIGVSDEEWGIIGPLLPPERGRCAQPAHDNRRFFEGMLWMTRTGSQWRQLPGTYGKWNSVFRLSIGCDDTGVRREARSETGDDSRPSRRLKHLSRLHPDHPLDDVPCIRLEHTGHHEAVVHFRD